MIERTIRLRNGVEIPRIGLGTFKSSSEQVSDAVSFAIANGIRHIDTASIYKNQEAIGSAIRASGVQRSQVSSCQSSFEHGGLKSELESQVYSHAYICTRFQQVFITSKVSPYEQGHAKAKQACTDILEKLGLNYVDLVLVHWPGD